MRLPCQAGPVHRGIQQGAAPPAIAGRPTSITDAGSVPVSGVNPAGPEECYNQQGLGRQLCLLSFEDG
jgi:hypothetical protein